MVLFSEHPYNLIHKRHYSMGWSSPTKKWNRGISELLMVLIFFFFFALSIEQMLH